MKAGLAPIGVDGKSVELQHMLQTQDGPIAEVTNKFHKDNSSVIHINPNTVETGIDRNKFKTWKRAYRKERAAKLEKQ